jgi:type II secretory pathway component PulK
MRRNRRVGLANRRGFAMLAAIWLLVAIAVVAMEFSLDARERGQIGLDASDRGRARAAATGALAMMQAQLELALRQGPTAGSANATAGTLRGQDPWLGVDSVYSGTIMLDSIPVDVIADDLGTQLNINNMQEQQIRTLFNFVLRDATEAGRIAQAIMDWRDVDSLPRMPDGAERDQYIREEQLALPSNAPFRELEEMLQVKWMTPEIYNQVAPYLTTYGSGRININTADTVVLRALPGMTDAILQRILGARSGGRRITSIAQMFPQQQQGRGGRGGGGQQQNNPTQEALEAAADIQTTEVQLTLIAYASPQALPIRLRAIVQRSNQTTTISWKQW